MGCANCFELRKWLKDESSGCVCHACTVNEDYADNGTSCAMCREMRRERQTRTNWCGTLSQPEPRESRSDHLLLHSWDFHDVLCRLDSRKKKKQAALFSQVPAQRRSPSVNFDTTTKVPG